MCIRDRPWYYLQFKNANIYLPEAYNTRLNFFVEGNTKAKNLASMLQEKYNDDIITINFRQAHGGSIEEIESTYRQSDIEYTKMCIRDSFNRSFKNINSWS